MLIFGNMVKMTMDQKVISVNETQMCRTQIRAAIPPKQVWEDRRKIMWQSI